MISRRGKFESRAVPRWHRGANIPRKLIYRYARDVASRFLPEKVILFGSYASGRPHADSDVDIVIVMPTGNELDQAAKICLAVDYRFPLDLLVRTPKNLAWRLAEGDSFLREVIDRGKVLYEKTNGRLGPKGREGKKGTSMGHPSFCLPILPLISEDMATWSPQGLKV